MTKIFTFHSSTNIVVQINDGVDVLALRAQWAENDDFDEEDGCGAFAGHAAATRTAGVDARRSAVS